jgi:hypothetical protein
MLRELLIVQICRVSGHSRSRIYENAFFVKPLFVYANRTWGWPFPPSGLPLGLAGADLRHTWQASIRSLSEQDALYVVGPVNQHTDVNASCGNTTSLFRETLFPKPPDK